MGPSQLTGCFLKGMGLLVFHIMPGPHETHGVVAALHCARVACRGIIYCPHTLLGIGNSREDHLGPFAQTTTASSSLRSCLQFPISPISELETYLEFLLFAPPGLYWRETAQVPAALRSTKLSGISVLPFLHVQAAQGRSKVKYSSLRIK